MIPRNPHVSPISRLQRFSFRCRHSTCAFQLHKVWEGPPNSGVLRCYANEMPTSTAFASATPWNSLKEKPEAAEIWWEKYRFHDPCHRGSGNHVKIEYLKIPIVISPVTSQCLGEPKVLVKAVDIGWKIEFGNYTVTILCWFNCIVQIFFVYRFPYIHKYIPNIYQYLISHYTWFLALWYCINPQLPSGKLT
jgi:hypothetical protein